MFLGLAILLGGSAACSRSSYVPREAGTTEIGADGTEADGRRRDTVPKNDQDIENPWDGLSVGDGLLDSAPDSFRCEPTGSATTCNQGRCRSQACPLGCDEASARCFVPSNVSPSLFPSQIGSLILTATNEPIIVDTNTGGIRTSTTEIRPPGVGLDATTKTEWTVTGSATAKLGVLRLKNLTLGEGTTVRVQGAHALIILAQGQVLIKGTLDVGAQQSSAGPGGFSGGLPDKPGGGPGGGQRGWGTTTCPNLCASGSGGGGHGGTGGAGGPVDIDAIFGRIVLPTPPGGAAYGDASLIPLVGGSGGAGGTTPGTYTKSGPARGGGGGGAIQISATQSIHVASTGIIAAPGDGGGGDTRSAGGAGGGAGGSILLEAPRVILDSGASLAANGGGGGAGDCT